MKTLIKDNRLVIGVYTLIILCLSFILLNHGKVQIHIFLNQIVGNAAIDKFFYYITYLGDGGVAPVLLLLIFLYNARLGVCCTISFLVAALAAFLLKHFMFDEVMRPWFVFQWYVKTPLKYVDTSDLYIHNSFPSGHAAVAWAAAFAVGREWATAGIVLALVAAGISVGAASGRYHYVIDVLLGLLVAVIAAVIT
jgi:membrane-associated phospholipid phosphatase